MPTIIKRYPNRKLYNTETKRYITLDGISTLIKQSNEVQVLDHTTGEDLTTLTLTQIIFEQEKKRGGFLPKSVLTGLIQGGGERIGSLRRTLGMPLDLLRQVDDEIERRMKEMITQGEVAREEGLRMLEKLLSYGPLGRTTENNGVEEAPLDSTEVAVRRMLEERDIPSRSEIQSLLDQLDDLASKLDLMEQEESASAEIN
ncbi:MAG: polyhydroxyalkanoate synthesis regulator DNA-binding domain-containing protein [Anaerolineae bacterium]|nr:polyhydroxyalkanoate synthesis regulator DNA-binding domain-containing protein [Anaerolineae bacterium]MCO5193672.1 polyhydroxyalkanoate synthesis regulator DNA-binding domain-containing protein [Anaerolineae bacterium]